MGSLRDLIWLLDPSLDVNIVLQLEVECQKLLRIPGKKASHEPGVPQACKLSLEAAEHLNRELAWLFRDKNWRTDERDWESMQAAEFDDPIKLSDVSGEFTVELKRSTAEVKPICDMTK